MTETVTWLHISDTHFCNKKNGWDSIEIIDSFFEDLTRMNKEYNLNPDLIFFTGDVAFGHLNDSCGLSLRDQYKEAEEFLEKIRGIFPRVPLSNIFIVPGNHDVNRTQITQDQIDWIRNLPKNGKEKASEFVNELIRSKNKQWIRYMERLEDYRNFLKERGYNHLLDDPELLTYSKICEINGFKVGITGLNSAWSSSGDGDKGNLWLGTYQILNSYNSIKDAMFSISLIHHPPNWFTEFEDVEIKKHLERMFTFCLHGHEHQDWVTVIDQHVKISSGALYNGHRNENVYNFVRLYPEEYKGEIFLRTYNNGFWIPYLIGGKTNNNGIINLNLEFLNISNFERRLDSDIKEENITDPTTNAVTYNHIENYPSTSNILNKDKYLKNFYTVDEFFSRYFELSKLLNHAHPFVGQDEILLQLNDFMRSEKRIALLSGRGGIGKSRILLEFGNNLKLENHEWELRYLSDKVLLTQNSVRELPDEKCIIIVDDAHRREDIVTLLEIAQQANNSIKIIMAFRPHGANYIKNSCNKCGFDVREIEEISEIQALKRAEKEELGKSILGQEHHQYLESLIQIAKDSTIVLVVGSRLVAEGKVQPALLEQDKEFQETVFRRFKEDIIPGFVNECLDAALCRDLLSVISILSPIQKDCEFIDRAAKFLEVKKSKLNASINTLERSRVLHRVGSKLRITPDILSDHILHNSCITSYGSSTGYSQEIFEAFEDIYLENILNNLSELDWQVTKQKRKTDLLVEIWNNIIEKFKNSSNFDRAVMLEKIEKVAYFQPQRTLDLIKYVINNPIKTFERDSTPLYKFTHKDVLIKIPSLLRNISHNIEYLQQSCELLWYLATNEVRQMKSESNYPMTILVDLAKYEMYKSLEYNKLVIEFVGKQLKNSSDYNHIYSLLDILDPMLEKEGIANRFTGVEVNFIPFSIPYENTKEIRQKVIALIGNYLSCDSTKVVLRALKSYFETLNQPTGFFGKKVSTDEIKIWFPEQIEILKIIEDFSKTTTDPIVKIQIKSSLYVHTVRSSHPDVANKASSIIEYLSEDFDVRLTRAIWYNYNWNYENFNKSQEKVLQEIKEVVIEFLKKLNSDGKQIFDSLNEMITKFKVNDILIHPEDFLRFLSVTDYKAAYEVCNYIISDKESPLANYLDSLLSGIRENDEMIAIRLTENAVYSNDPILCRSIAKGYAYSGWAFRLRNEEIKIITNLLLSVEIDTRNLAIKSLGHFPETLMKEALELALGIEIGDDEKLADTYCSIFNERGISLRNLDNEQLKLILKKISKIRTLDENLYHVNIFLNHCSTKIPEELVDFLLKRLDFSKNVKRKTDDRFQPLPYDGFSDKGLNGIPLSRNYINILRKVRNRSLNEDFKNSFWLPKLYLYISENFSLTSLEVLSEWIDTEDEDKIRAVGLLVKEAPSDFVFINSDFISNLLSSAQLISDECYKEVRSDISYSVLYGVKTGIPGQACPQDEKLRDRAQEYMDKHQSGSIAWKFYNWLYEEANGSIDDWLKRDAERVED